MEDVGMSAPLSSDSLAQYAAAPRPHPSCAYEMPRLLEHLRNLESGINVPAIPDRELIVLGNGPSYPHAHCGEHFPRVVERIRKLQGRQEDEVTGSEEQAEDIATGGFPPNTYSAESVECEHKAELQGIAELFAERGVSFEESLSVASIFRNIWDLCTERGEKAERELANLKDTVVKRSGVSSWDEWAGDWDQTEESAADYIVRMRKQLAEAREDTARLDWLEGRFSQSFRAAIDAARGAF
jgi:hypothetical protein